MEIRQGRICVLIRPTWRWWGVLIYQRPTGPGRSRCRRDRGTWIMLLLPGSLPCLALRLENIPSCCLTRLKLVWIFLIPAGCRAVRMSFKPPNYSSWEPFETGWDIWREFTGVALSRCRGNSDFLSSDHTNGSRGHKSTLHKSHQLWVSDILISFCLRYTPMCCKLLQDSIKCLWQMPVHIHGHNTMKGSKTWSSASPRTLLSRGIESQRKHELLKPYFPISTTERSQHPWALVEKERFNKCRKRDICKTPSPESKSDTQTDACSVRVDVKTDWHCPACMFTSARDDWGRSRPVWVFTCPPYVLQPWLGELAGCSLI